MSLRPPAKAAPAPRACTSGLADVYVKSARGSVAVTVWQTSITSAEMPPGEAQRFADTLCWAAKYAGEDPVRIYEEGPSVRKDREGRVCIVLGGRELRFGPDDARRTAESIWDASREARGEGPA